jgi:hypothetical protein
MEQILVANILADLAVAISCPLENEHCLNLYWKQLLHFPK